MSSSSRVAEKLFVGMQYLLPQHLLSRGMHAVARVQAGPVKNAIISTFLRFYAVNMSEAEHSDPHAYPSFNAFFTRALKPGARPVDTGRTAIVSPVDGLVSQAGPIERDMLLQAKGIHYSAESLLGGDAALAANFEGGDFATIYLAPFNYHRIHMPYAGTLRRARYIGGDLFSVNGATAANVPSLFARNERIACVFDTTFGPMAVVLVGALFVGSMSLVWAGEVTAERTRMLRELPSTDPLVALDKAAELGRFNMGSTVILMFPRGVVRREPGLTPGSQLRMGERIATLQGP